MKKFAVLLSSVLIAGNIAYADELNKAHQSLMDTKYFDNFTEENKKYLKVEVPKSGGP